MRAFRTELVIYSKEPPHTWTLDEFDEAAHAGDASVHTQSVREIDITDAPAAIRVMFDSRSMQQVFDDFCMAHIVVLCEQAPIFMKFMQLVADGYRSMCAYDFDAFLEENYKDESK